MLGAAARCFRRLKRTLRKKVLVSKDTVIPVRILLASASPRRRLLLPLLGLPVEVTQSEVDEQARPHESPRALALRLAEAKARAASESFRDSYESTLVVGADTVVALDDRTLGKPVDAAEAQEMLRALRARPHQVITGVAVYRADRAECSAGAVTTEVDMRAYSEEEIEAYIARGEPFDKAGAYAIQDPLFRPVERLVGCFPNVVGLPLREVVRLLHRQGYTFPSLPAEPLTAPCRLCDLTVSELERHRMGGPGAAQ